MPIDAAFIAISLLTLTGALGAVLLRSLLHCALSAAVAFIGLAAFYLKMDAQFAGFAQVLVYVGAIAVLVLFAVLLTGGIVRDPKEPVFASGWTAAVAIGVVLFLILGGCILASRALPGPPSPGTPLLTVQQIGVELMTRYVLALEVVGLLLTAALLGAVLIAARKRSSR